MLSVIETDADYFGRSGNRGTDSGFCRYFFEKFLIGFEPGPESLKAIGCEKIFIPVLTE
jgi:hypothetical protein